MYRGGPFGATTRVFWIHVHRHLYWGALGTKAPRRRVAVGRGGEFLVVMLMIRTTDREDSRTR
jgi:hypothetical protein